MEFGFEKTFENMWNFHENSENFQGERDSGSLEQNRNENEVEVDVETFDEHEPHLAPKVISTESYQGWVK